ncbi:coiled-coil domain-containing protein 97 isoform X2 [Orussus abietinus]|uniref:coiled-coil domain-containing protein 97 isoform X2 n=1 Tax=Orussus abietinus TaxID=222816 RepID=UPI000C715DA3|nr:coiled-coil domain-containing protein 97 isoform X2 [Orussus abietinus]
MSHQDAEGRNSSSQMISIEKDEIAPESAVSSSESQDRINFENEILDYVANSKAPFKSQHKDEPDLTYEEKRTIASNLLHKSHCLFLSKFGTFLKTDHLNYFKDTAENDYEVAYHVNRLQRYYNSSTRQIDVKNRRYQALKTLIEKGEYFSEVEMMKRNPLLYDHLIGQYLTEEQRKARDNIDTKNITFVNLLLESIDKENVRNLKKAQQEKENDVTEETDTDEETDEEFEQQESMPCNEKTNCMWGEEINSALENEEKEKLIQTLSLINIPNKEKQMLKNEFVTLMYQNFLDGKDSDFDYSTVDDNEAYDNIDLRTQDEEEKYFDSESPETVPLKEKEDLNESEDELDLYMKSLKVK